MTELPRKMPKQLTFLFLRSHRSTAEVFGTPLEAMDIELNSNRRYFGVRFNSGVMPDFLNISASEMINKHHQLSDLIPQSNQLVEQVASDFNFTNQVALFSHFINTKTDRKKSSLTSQVINNIYMHQGNIKIKELASLTGYTARTLQRKFNEDIGMSPKIYSRIIRCQSAVYKINHSDKVAFSDLAYDLGFTDQPHFLREFKKLVNTPPLSYQNRVKDKSYLNKLEYV